MLPEVPLVEASAISPRTTKKCACKGSFLENIVFIPLACVFLRSLTPQYSNQIALSATATRKQFSVYASHFTLSFFVWFHTARRTEATFPQLATSSATSSSSASYGRFFTKTVRHPRGCSALEFVRLALSEEGS